MTGGLLDLQSYLFAKLMWDPDYDVQKGIKEFSQASYGAAAADIVSYVRMINDPDTYVHQAAELHRGWWTKTPIKKAKLREMDELFDRAERAVAADPDILERVKMVRLSVQYAILLYADKDDPVREKAFLDFFPLLKKARLPLPEGL